VSGLPLLTRLRRVLALVSDPRTPRLPRLAVAVAIAYLLWPADLLPDFMPPIVGWIDDALMVWLSVRWLLHSAAKNVGIPVPPPDAGAGAGPLRP
jgi:uncharacterized membrane protein YkvA (DUF1232 family)